MEIRNNRNTISKLSLLLSFSLIILCSLFTASSHAEVLERVVAIVNDEVVLLSDLREAMQAASAPGRELKEEEVLDGMIDNILLIEQARKMRLDRSAAYRESPDSRMLIDEYLQKRIKVLILIPFGDVEAYYAANRDRYKGREFIDVRDEIEDYLTEREFSVKKLEHIKELREKAYIRKQLSMDE